MVTSFILKSFLRKILYLCKNGYLQNTITALKYYLVTRNTWQNCKITQTSAWEAGYNAGDAFAMGDAAKSCS
jgi:hypothetical protein